MSGTPWNQAAPEDKASVNGHQHSSAPPSKAIVMLLRGSRDRVRVGVLIGTREVSIVLSKSAAREYAKLILNFVRED